MSVPSEPHLLASLRRRLTFWYAGTLSLILILLGSGLYAAIHTQLSRQLDRSLHVATRELIRAANIREMEALSAQGNVVDAVDELHIPDRKLFLLDTTGRPIKPAHASALVRAVAMRAAHGASITEVDEEEGESNMSIHAERFRLASGAPMIAVVSADQVELADRYASLIAAFGIAALAAIVLVSAGAYFLAQKSLAPAERSLTYTRRFMADAAHELRTPIAVLRTRAEAALQTNRSAEEYKSALRGMETETRRLSRVVDELLMLARADAGERPVMREQFFLDDVVLDAAQSVGTIAHATGVTLELQDFEETPITGDSGLVRELVIVLLDNAVKFTPSGGTVRVRVLPSPQPTLTIEDTGCGIPEDQLKHVFERFYRGDASRSRKGGAGLGLSIARWIAMVHDARITLDSELNRGTSARVVFPNAMPSPA